MFKKLILGLILVVGVVNPSLGIQTPDQTNPSLAPANPLIPPVYFDDLLNGLQILIVERPDQSDVTLGFMIKKGSAFDLVGREGSADLAARIVLRGDQIVSERPLAQLFQELEVEADATVTWDATRFTFRTPSKNLLVLLPILAEILTRSTFPENDVEKLKQERLKELNQRRPMASTLADRELFEQIFARHPYARPIEGTVQSIEAITAADLSRVHRRFYLANDAVLTIVGNVTAQAILPSIRPTFGALRRGKIVPSTFTAPMTSSGVQIKILDRPDSHDAFIRLGYRTVHRGHDDFLPLMLLSQSLTSSLSRLADTFSPEPVTLGSHLDGRVLMGSFFFSATAPGRLAPAVVSTLLQFIGRLRDQGVAPSDLDEAKSYLTGHFPDQVRTNRQISEQLQEIELYDLGRDYLRTFDQRLDRVTPEQVKKVAANTLSITDLFIVIGGPAGEMMEGLKPLGTVDVVN